ncbi:MAG: hypothetical protein HY698_07065 [Deltaproteobacteria bacterium]|nr:hypothetical protein [Deltaproteobacteria bacterium]
MSARAVQARAILLALAVVALGYALQVNQGAYHRQAIPLLLATLGLVLASQALPTRGALRESDQDPVLLVIGIGVAVQLGVLATARPGISFPSQPADLVPYYFALAVAGVIVGSALSAAPWLGKAGMPLLLLVHFAIGAWLLGHGSKPHIDVYAWHEEAFRLLTDGSNPYSGTMPNIYPHARWYGPNMVENGRVLVGFPYPPLSLLLAGMGRLAGDYRYATLSAITLSGMFMAYARPGRLATAAAALFLFTPRAYFVVDQGWTEPFLVLLVSFMAFCACRAPKLVPVALGLLLAIKQYMVFAAPLALLLIPRPWSLRKLAAMFLPAAGVVLVLALPFFTWDPRGFARSIVLFQATQPFRIDSLSVLAWLARRTKGLTFQGWITFAAALPILAHACWRGARTISGFTAGLAATILCFFAFSKQAFCNYYFFIIGAACCAVAVTGVLKEESAGQKGAERPRPFPTG